MEELQQQERFVIFVLQDHAVMEAQNKLRVALEALLLLEAQAALLVEMTQATLRLELRLA